jgi:DNA polymerase
MQKNSLTIKNGALINWALLQKEFGDELILGGNVGKAEILTKIKEEGSSVAAATQASDICPQTTVASASGTPAPPRSATSTPASAPATSAPPRSVPSTPASAPATSAPPRSAPSTPASAPATSAPPRSVHSAPTVSPPQLRAEKTSNGAVTPGPFAAKISALRSLKEAICAFDGCPLKAMATNTVFGDGSPMARVMFIGEAPGADEDRQGVPFVGKSGQLLNKMLASIGLSRSEVYITNVVNWRPPGNRPPTTDEVAQCRPFLMKHIEIIAPQIIVLLGATAMNGVLQRRSSLAGARGQWFSYALNDETEAKVMVTFHPSYLLRSPEQKTFAWKDLLRLKEELDATG